MFGTTIAKTLARYGLAGIALALAFPLAAHVTLPKLFTDHMVLQRDEPVHVWGWALRGQKVTVSFRGETESATADAAGRWDVYLSPGSAGGPFDLEVHGTNEITLHDILVGDVWVASGQSNMEMPVSGFDAAAAGGKAAPTKDSAKEIAAANHPQIRLLRLEKQHSAFPLDDVITAKGWQVCAPETVGPFAAVAYFFARDLQAATNVTIGVIQSTWGGTQGAGWVSMETLTSDPDQLPLLADCDARFRNRATETRQINMNKLMDEADRAAGRPVTSTRVRQFPESWRPAGLFNGMIAPLAPLRIKGFLWYQGESDWEVLNGRHYGKLLPALIADWRRTWKQGNLPFLFVQTASHGSAPFAWPPVREAQRRTLAVANTGMATTTDIGDEANVHPANKQDVGLRLSLIARALVYGQPVEFSGPAYRETSSRGNGLQVWFDHANGMTAKGGTLEGFEIAGADHQFVPATAEIRGDAVFVTSAQISKPVFVRYAWRSNPVLTLYNAAGLPASPFTSEQAY